jgi:Na+-translocating ferredoxin:NAD+ oxidoreductase RNF subunit RnfB
MALSVVDLYRDVLPKTNCGDCGFPTCLAFAGMVVSDQHPLEDCPHLSRQVVEKCNRELGEQYAAGKWTRRDLAEDALTWARERSASMDLAALPDRIGGVLESTDGQPVLKLPYFTGHVLIRAGDIV